MLRFAFANLASRRGRTFLATLGLTIAIAGMVGLFAIAGGIDDLLESSLARIPGIVVLQPGAPIPLFSALPAAWGEDLANVEGVGVVNPEVWTRVNLLEGHGVISPPRLLLGTDPITRSRLKHGVYNECLEQGRFLDERDVNQPQVVISRQIAEEVGKTVGDPLDVNGREMTIVGIYHCGSLILDVTIIADISVVRELARIDANTVNAFYVEPAEGIPVSFVVAAIQQAAAPDEQPDWEHSSARTPLSLPPITLIDVLKRFAASLETHRSRDRHEGDGDHRPDPHSGSNDAPHHSAPWERLGDFVSVMPVAEWGERFTQLTADLDLVLALLTGLGIAIALSSILNTMMMSVSERTVEFGVLRANGWSQRDVLRLIVCESVLVGLAGGLVGILSGWIATLVINHIWSNRVHLYAGPFLLLGSLLFSVCVGILGGFYPALRAARMSPMQAIRRA